MAEQNHRLCISCRETAHRETLLQIVRTYPEHHIQLNQGTERSAAGRSAYLCPTAECWQNAKKKNRLSRALKTAVSKETLERLEGLVMAAIAQTKN